MSSEGKRNADRIEDSMEQTRRHLADSVGALADKADVRDRVRTEAEHLADEAKMQAERTAAEARIKAAEARDLAAARASHLKSRAGELSPGVLAALVVVPIAVLLLLRRLRRR